MKAIPLPINSPPYKNSDSAESTELSDELIDGRVDENGCSIRRPGLLDFADVGTGVDGPTHGTYIWSSKDVAIGIAGGRIFKFTDELGTYTELTGATLIPGVMTSFIDTGDYLFMANGGQMIYTNGTDITAYVTDADAPKNVRKLACVKGYILATVVGTGEFRYCEPFDYQNWPAVNFISAEGSPDELYNLIINNQEVTLFGSKSIEPMYVGPAVSETDDPFSFLQGGYIERGLTAIDSPIKVNNTIYFLDDEEKFSQITGRSAQAISTPFDRYIASFSRVDDAIGMDINCEGMQLYVITFPTAGVTIVYDYILQIWGRWGYWDSVTNTYEAWLGQSHSKWISKRINLVGSRKDGKFYKLTSSSHTDGGSPIRLVRTTGNITHGTYREKYSGSLRIRFKRGEASSSGNDPVVMLRIKDNGSLFWSSEIQGSLGKGNDKEFFIEFAPMGTYISRQYEISISDDVPVILVGAEEMVDVA